jgi:hypothetical protein
MLEEICERDVSMKSTAVTKIQQQQKEKKKKKRIRDGELIQGEDILCSRHCFSG